MYRSLTSLEQISVCGVKSEVQFHHITKRIWFYCHLWKNICVFIGVLQRQLSHKSNFHIYESFCSMFSLLVHWQVSYCLNYSVYVNSWYLARGLLHLTSRQPQISFWFFHINFRISLQSITKKILLWFFIRIAFNLYRNFSRICIFIILNILILKYHIVFHLFRAFSMWSHKVLTFSL